MDKIENKDPKRRTKSLKKKEKYERNGKMSSKHLRIKESNDYLRLSPAS
jgi:hypothetical protein